ncbi:MAG: MBL fold metallo-hydrolase [Chloroflexota bacterium]|nr:MBL fold metallo-hydrolase [Chloroflexota bacterium]
MHTARIDRITDNVCLVDPMPSIHGFQEFLGTYVLMDEKIGLVDVGPTTSIENLLRGLAALGVNASDVDYIFITHIHIDHAGGLGTVMKHMPQAKVVVHEKGRPHLVDPQRLWEGSKKSLGKLADEYGEIEGVPEDSIIIVEDNMCFELGRTMIVQALLTPGHAPHHVSFLERHEGRLFLGEVGGVNIRGLIRPGTPAPFDFEHQITSLDRMIQISPSAICYGHFGCVERGTKELVFHRNQLLLWREIITECCDSGIAFDDIYDRIAQKDRMLKDIERLPKDQYERERFFIINSIKGFISYFKK